MNRSQIEASKQLAKEFIKAADAALGRLDAENEQRDEWNAIRFERGINEATPPPGPQPSDYSFGSPETGALKRRSMDLTRSLAVLRK